MHAVMVQDLHQRCWQHIFCSS